MTIFTDNQYHWLITHLPFRIMYKRIWIDDMSRIWIPRWGASKKQIDDAKAWAEDMNKNIKWE